MSARAGDYRIRIQVEYHAGEDGFVPSDVCAYVSGLDEVATKHLHAYMVAAGIERRHEVARRIEADERRVSTEEQLAPDDRLARWIAKVDDVSTPHDLELVEAEFVIAEYPSVGARAAMARARNRVAELVEGEAERPRHWDPGVTDVDELGGRG